MSDIGKIKITSEWSKVEDLIKAQVSGQSSFSFDVSKDYQLQSDSATSTVMFGAYLCESSSTPENPDDGEYLVEGLTGQYKPTSGKYLWIKTRGNTTDVKVSVSELG